MDAHLQVPVKSDVYALGDCVEVEHQVLPATAQAAMQQGSYLARCFNSNLDPPPFRFRSLGMMAYIASDRAVVDTETDKGSGRLAWLFWRSVYLTRLVRLRNKLKVLTDWFMTSIFGRDISQF